METLEKIPYNTMGKSHVTACDHNTLYFVCQDGSSLQIIVQKGVSDCLSLYQSQFQTPRRGSFQVLLYEKEAGPSCEKVLF